MVLGKPFRESALVPSILKQGSFSLSQGRFDMPSGTYSLGPFLGKGTYGNVYQVVHTTLNQVSVIKVIELKRADVSHTIKESIVHILMEKDSEKQPGGPYVPHFYEMAYDPLRNYILLRMERLHGDLRNLIYGSTKEQNDAIIPKALGDISHIMAYFHKTLQFNHRDLKADNVGFVLDDNGNYAFKLIDFGFACITWKGIQIAGSTYFPLTAPCNIPSRDLTSLMFQLLDYRNYYSAKLREFIQRMLTFHSCKMYEGCNLNGFFVKKDDWLSTYDFLNNPRFHNPHAVPKELHRRVLEFLGQAPTPHTTLMTPTNVAITSKIKMCLPEQVLNPKTRRCVRRAGKVGRQILRQMELSTPSPTRKATRQLAPCKPGQVRNERTRRCKYTCPSTQIRNPATKQCVSRDGVLGRKLWAQGVRPTPQL